MDKEDRDDICEFGREIDSATSHIENAMSMLLYLSHWAFSGTQMEKTSLEARSRLQEAIGKIDEARAMLFDVLKDAQDDRQMELEETQ